MKPLFLITIICLSFINSVFAQEYKLNSYLDIRIGSNGNLPRNPYVINLKNREKKLTIIGTQHNRDTLSPMFTGIEEAFKNLNPQIVINEGPTLYKTYVSRNISIVTDGELGLEKFLADKVGIKTVSGDEPDREEFEELTKAFSREEALVFFASERFVFPFKFGQYKGGFPSEYRNNFIKDYLLKSGINLSPEERELTYYLGAYKKYFHQDFNLDSIDQHNFTPFGRGNHFNDVTRKSKELRDRYLLKQISAQLKQYDRVLVIYGGWHVLAIEPALNQIIGKP